MTLTEALKVELPAVCLVKEKWRTEMWINPEKNVSTASLRRERKTFLKGGMEDMSRVQDRDEFTPQPA